MRIQKSQLIAGLTGAILLFILLTGVRALLYQPDDLHYHGNFAVFINGEREPFKEFTYYEEVTACDTSDSNPKRRVHMHNFESDVVHVHDQESTWGHFFHNLGWQISDNLIETRKGLYRSNESAKLTFLLNGEPVTSIYNRVIGNEDTLLINFGSETAETLKERSDSLQNKAAQHNVTADPSTCSGNQPLNWQSRLKHALGL